jgi:exopolyphosphatase / guanosine-5'-triphosphate,3'-diphosphate pyrophosphatase
MQFDHSLQATERILAAIDVGTNSIHMVVVQIQPALPSFKIIATEKDTVRLGERCQETGRLTAGAMERSLAALRRCQELASSFQAEEIIAVATSAIREAPNGREFLEQVFTDLGLKVDLISGEEEARRIYLGVLSAIEFKNQPHVIIDIGGGSTEIILGDGGDPRYLSSTKVGAVRLTELFVHSDPINESDYCALRDYVRGLLEWPIESVRSHLRPGEIPLLVGTSGTIESLFTIHSWQKQGTAPASFSGHVLTLAELQTLREHLSKLNYDQRSQLLGMSERRAEIILSGAVILQEAMALLGLNSLVTCDRALREGMIVDWMLTHGLIEDRLRYQSSVRQRSVISMAQKYRVNLDNGQRVAEFAVSLFDQTQGILHSWELPERQLLWAAAVLHNCGHYVSHAAHHKHSYYLVRHGELLGYTDAEVEAIANLCRYHRRSIPRKKHENYRILSSQYRQRVDQLSALLRLAVALDRRQIGAITRISCNYFPTQRELHLHLTPATAEDSCLLELWNLDYKKDTFEAEFGIKLVVRLPSSKPEVDPSS